jgi:hypothetical protein
MNRPDHDLFAGWRATLAPAGLEDRVLAAIREGARPPHIGLVNRMWENQALRIGWLAAAALLMAINLWMPTAPGTGSEVVVARTDDEVDVLLASLMERYDLRTPTLADQNLLIEEIFGNGQSVSTTLENGGENS